MNVKSHLRRISRELRSQTSERELGSTKSQKDWTQWSPITREELQVAQEHVDDAMSSLHYAVQALHERGTNLEKGKLSDMIEDVLKLNDKVRFAITEKLSKM